MTAASRLQASRLAAVMGIPVALAPTVLGIVVLVVLRIVASAILPLSSDEAYYWLWSKHLQAGYLDHPPAIAWIIRAGTSLFGDTPFGVRFGATVSSGAATWFVWRAAADLLEDEEAGARAALWFNLTLMVAVETLAATPDAPALLASSAFLYALVRVRESSDGRWWLAAGFAGGLALLSKFTALFLAAGALGWTIVDPLARRWLASPWTFAGALVALVLYVPNLVWNANHGWATYVFQFGRISQGHFDLRYLAEFFLAQIGLCSPFIFLLGAMGLGRTMRNENLRLIAAMLWPAIAYFLVHALHDRVQANWPSFLLPAFCIAAVIASKTDRRPARMQALAPVARRAAAPVAAAILTLAYAQAFFGVVPVGRGDPLTRLLGFGLEDVAAKVGQLQAKVGARSLLVTDYESAAWFGFYLPPPASIIALNESERWTFVTAAGGGLSGDFLYVAEAKRDEHGLLTTRFHRVTPLGEIQRTRRGVVIAHYVVYRVSGFEGGSPGHRLP